jgi:exopolysaccharide biosynthesis protein
MPVPKMGCLLSLGDDFPSELIPKPGDTVYLHYTTNFYQNKIFKNAVSGTPRLVRNGSAHHEAAAEGSRGRRFLNRPLPRSAIGTNEDKSVIYLVAVENANKGEYNIGANLTQMATIMKKAGCHDAMNLDGGGSTIMVLDGKNIIRKHSPNSSRRISVGAVATRKKGK